MSSLFSADRTRPGSWRQALAAARALFWFKTIGITGFIWIFFLGYFFVLNHHAGSVTIMPLTAVDRLVGIHPLALPVYLTLWIYVALPPGLMMERREMLQFGVWMAGLCALGLGIFYFWPTAVLPADVDWSRYPGMSFLKNVDASGNACPSLHVATAVFSALCLEGRLRELGLGRGWRVFSWVWCLAILYSTMATGQHVALDVAAGSVLGGTFALAYRFRAFRPALAISRGG